MMFAVVFAILLYQLINELFGHVAALLVLMIPVGFIAWVQIND